MMVDHRDDLLAVADGRGGLKYVRKPLLDRLGNRWARSALPGKIGRGIASTLLVGFLVALWALLAVSLVGAAVFLATASTHGLMVAAVILLLLILLR